VTYYHNIYVVPVYTAVVGKGKGCNWRPSL